MQDSAYLAELGGLSAHRRSIMPDLRGTGRSAAREDIASYHCDRLVDDMDALREHLGLERTDLLAHSACTNLPLLYTERHPAHVGRLGPITPSVVAVGVRGRAARDGTAAQGRGVVPGGVRGPGIDGLRPSDHRFAAGDRAVPVRPLGRSGPDPSRRGKRATERRSRGRLRRRGRFRSGCHPHGTGGVRTAHAPARREGRSHFPSPGRGRDGSALPSCRAGRAARAGHLPRLDDADRFAAAITAFPG
ncbi:alpha/beta fold hydrolase [Streptomyces sp. HUAS TT11]|uniref:alpha/beta fold hydrolase n=1 Tax=Streptomyces sp. HUAS TT11 TaxID=3447508 RepID=UPI003F654E03